MENTPKVNETKHGGIQAGEGDFYPTPVDPANVPKGVIAQTPQIENQERDERPIARISIRKWAVIVDIIHNDTLIDTKFLRYEEIDISHDNRLNVRYVRIITPTGRQLIIDKLTYRNIDVYYHF